MQWALIGYGFSILTLFLNFYFQAYIKPSKVKVGYLLLLPYTHLNAQKNAYMTTGDIQIIDRIVMCLSFIIVGQLND